MNLVAILFSTSLAWAKPNPIVTEAGKQAEARSGQATLAGTLEAIEALYVTGEVNGVLQTNRVNGLQALVDCCPGCRSVDSRHFYSSHDLMLKDLVRVCSSSSGPSRHMRINYTETTPCKRNRWLWIDDNYHSDVAYDIESGQDGVRIRQKLRFKVDTARGISEETMLRTARQCIPKIQAVWARYGVRFDLEFDSQTHPAPGSPHHVVNYKAGEGRSDAGTFYYLGFYSQESDDQREAFCKLMLHETGHLLGLDDEYVESSRNCPDRPLTDLYGPPYSIMNNQNHPWEDLTFSANHIIKVIGPLCRRR